MYHSPVGAVSVGDYVEFSYPSGTRVGRITNIEECSRSVTLSIYCSGSTGGYTLSAPIYNVSRILILDNQEGGLEDINKPKRYNKVGDLECWDVILDQNMNFLEGNILKYIWRYKEKNGVQDLKKAKVYLEKLILETEK
jgi:hypothetical protein